MKQSRHVYAMLIVPLLIVMLAFFVLPMARLVAIAADGPRGYGTYLITFTEPRYLRSFINTILLSIVVTAITVTISTVSALFLQRNHFPARNVLIAMLTFPLAFPGVVVGFMVIMLGGRQGVVSEALRSLFGWNAVFAYSMLGLLVGYVYFSIPRVVLTVFAAAEKLDLALEEAARSLGASTWQVVRDVIIPGLGPALLSSSAICFATAMGAFGTAFTLATDIDVLPMSIYTEFTLRANIAVAAALSIVLGLITWLALALARSAAGASVAAAG
jgi:putative spermidine/putrescine transport system permease protein